MKRFLLMILMICGGLISFIHIAPAKVAPYAEGETLTYVIRKFGMKAGDAVIRYHGLVEEDGKNLVLITFTAKGFNFLDDEKIFADPNTLLPVKVERDLNIFGNREQIVEQYDLIANTVNISKYQRGKLVDEVVFKKDTPIDNLYCYIFRYRKYGSFMEGTQLQMNLPTKNVNFEIVRNETINAMGSRHEAWFMQSRPPEFQVWFSAGQEKVPLRIDGAEGLAKTIMVLERHQKGKIE